MEQVETDGWNNEQVHGGNVRRVVTQEGSPSIAGRSPPFDRVLGDTRLRDLKPELQQFAVDAWRAPKRILHAHPPDQNAQLRLDRRSPSQWARLPTPVAAKAGPVPTHQRQYERCGARSCPSVTCRPGSLALRFFTSSTVTLPVSFSFVAQAITIEVIAAGFATREHKLEVS